MDARLKAKYKYHHGRSSAAAIHAHTDDKKASKMQLLSREARSNQRRLLTAFGMYSRFHIYNCYGWYSIMILVKINTQKLMCVYLLY